MHGAASLRALLPCTTTSPDVVARLTPPGVSLANEAKMAPPRPTALFPDMFALPFTVAPTPEDRAPHRHRRRHSLGRSTYFP